MYKPLATAVFALGLVAIAPAASAATMECDLTFNLKGWSIFYKTSSGEGVVTCTNGERMLVTLEAKGGGITVGKSEIKDGIGKFSNVHGIKDILGSYATAEAHAGAGKSTKAEAMTNGDVSLALAGKGTGWDVGIAFGKLTIAAK